MTYYHKFKIINNIKENYTVSVYTLNTGDGDGVSFLDLLFEVSALLIFFDIILFISLTSPIFCVAKFMKKLKSFHVLIIGSIKK